MSLQSARSERRSDRRVSCAWEGTPDGARKHLGLWRVRGKGGEALANTAWSVITGRGLFAPLRRVVDEPWRLLAVGTVVVLATQLV